MCPPPVEPADTAQAGPATRPSKTQLKQRMHELQRLGEQLAALPEPKLAAIPMPEALREAIDAYRHTRSHEGRRRQLQFIGKQMRSADPEPLREALRALELGSARATQRLHQAERWRAELIAGDDALDRWAVAHPEADLQRLRTLVRTARREAAGSSPDRRHGRAYRELFQFIEPCLP